MTRLRHRISFRLFLAISALVILLPLLMVGGMILSHNSQLNQRMTEAELRAMARLATAALDADLSNWLGALERVASSSGIDAGDPAGAQQIFGNYLLRHPTTRSLSLLGRDGKPIIQVGHLSDRDISAVAGAMGLPAALTEARSRFSGLLHDQADGEPLIGLAVPIRRGASLVGLLLAIQRPDELEVIIEADDARLGWQAAIVDQHNVVAAHLNPTLVGQPFPYPQLLPEPGETEPIFRLVLLDGTASYIALRRSTVAPWLIVYLVPAAVLAGRLQQSWLDWGLLLGLLALPITGSALLGRYLGRRIEALAEAAKLVSNEATPFVMVPTGLREIDAVQEALQHASEATQERAAARERMSDMNLVLHRAQRMESIGQLTAGLAHDFGNLIFTIRGNLELIKRALGDDARVQRLVDPPLRLADEAARLISQLSSGIRHKQNRTQQVNVDQLLREVADLLRQVAGRAVRVNIEPGSGLFECRLDPTLLKSALLNLVINARNAMRRGGEIHIRSETLVLDNQAAAVVGLASAGRYVALSVADTGIGIPPELRARVFEPFFTTREGGAGMGIGLSILYGFVKSAGGHVVVDSAVGVGTTFTMYFPAEPSPRASINRVYSGGGTDSDSPVNRDSSSR